MSNDTIVRNLRVVYVDDTESSYYGYLTVYLSDEVTLAELVQVTEYLEGRPEVSSVEPFFRDKVAALRVHPRGQLTSAAKTDLLELLSPQFTRKMSAEANVQRDNNGVHQTTRITMRVAAGDNLNGFNSDRACDNTDGVQRVRVIGRESSILIFLMERPAANDDDGAITAVAKKMAEKLSAMLIMPVTVNESDEYAALDPTKDYRPATPDQSTTQTD